MKSRKKLITPFLFVLLISFLILGTRSFFIGSDENKPYPNKEDDEKWKGIITLWYIPYIDTATGSNNAWLNSRIEEFEGSHPGVFIDLKKIEPKRARIYFEDGVDKSLLPDIISLSPYEGDLPQNFLLGLSDFFKEDEMGSMSHFAKKFMTIGDNFKAVPYMMGAYGVFFNRDLLKKKEILEEPEKVDFKALDSLIEQLSYSIKEGKKELDYYGFGTYSSQYSNPIMAMVYDGEDRLEESIGFRYIENWIKDGKKVPENMDHMDNKTALKLFLNEGRVGVFLGNTQTIYRNRALRLLGKGIDLGIGNIPMEGKNGIFQDQVALLGVIDKGNDKRNEYSLAFIKSLLTHDAQGDLGKIGMFPVIGAIDNLYGDDREMSLLESTVKDFTYSPKDIINNANSWELLKYLFPDQP